MNKLIVPTLLSLVLISTLAYAQTTPQQSLQGALDEIAKYFPDDNVHVQLSLTDGTAKSFTVITSGGKVSSFTEGVPQNPTLIISTSQAVLEKIYSSSNQAGATIQALNNGGITITPVGFVNQLKLVFFKIVTTISGFFIKG